MPLAIRPIGCAPPAVELLSLQMERLLAPSAVEAGNSNVSVSFILSYRQPTRSPLTPTDTIISLQQHTHLTVVDQLRHHNRISHVGSS